jgi:putative DNA primase/helicase
MFRELLLEEFNINMESEIEAEKIYSKLTSVTAENTQHYRWSVDKNSGENYIISFFPKIFYDKFFKKQKIISISGTENIYKYNTEKGIYEKYDFKSDIMKLMNVKDPNIDKNPIKVINIIKIENSINPNEINKDDDYINFRNGMFNLKTKQLEEHSDKFLSTRQVQSNYNINSSSIKGTKFEKYLSDSFYPEDIPTLQEWIGYCLSNYMGAQKFCVFNGEGENGKGTLIRIISSIFDEEFVSSVDLSRLSRQEYAARLFGKAMNVCGDISDSYIKDSSLIKQLTGEDSIEAKELYSNPFNFLNKAKITFSCNKLPQTSDKTIGFLRRLLVISCDKKLIKKIDGLSKMIITEELEKVINWSMVGLYRLIENGFKFTTSEKTDNNVILYKKQNDNILSFVEDYCHITNDCETVPKNEFIMFYKEYCKMNNIMPQSSRNIQNYMREKNVLEIRTTIRSWKGIMWDITIKELVDSYNLSNKLTGNNKYEIKGHCKYNLNLLSDDEKIIAFK